MNNAIPNVEKADGEKVPFDVEKIKASLRRAKANEQTIDSVVSSVEKKLFDGIHTSELYRIVFNELRKSRRGTAGKYNLKRAIMALGPPGGPFEKFISELWNLDGFTTNTGIVVDGKCVSHEVDVVAEKSHLTHFVECKHHSVPGKICSIKNALYVSARMNDLKIRKLDESGDKLLEVKGWLVTNTRFSTDAIQFGLCADLGLLSWDFPKGQGLRERIDKRGIHPITSITSLSYAKTAKLIRRDMLLCRDLAENPYVLKQIGIRGAKADEVLEEASEICAS